MINTIVFLLIIGSYFAVIEGMMPNGISMLPSNFAVMGVSVDIRW